MLINSSGDKLNRARRAIVLMYHRVNALRPDPWTLAVSPANFAEQLTVARELTAPIALGELPTIVAGEAPPPKKMPLAVTFDDGYADNFEFACPLLEKFEIPATVFVTAGRVGALREFWWDELERIFLQPNRLPATLKLTIGAHDFEFDLGDDCRYTNQDATRDADWNCVADDSNPTIRHKIYRALFDALRVQTTDEQRRILTRLFRWAKMIDDGSEFLTARANRRMMNESELVQLSNNPQIEIGAHTLTHPVLSTLAPAAQFDEIAGGKTILEKIVGAPVRGFAYPNGFPTDYTAETVAAVKNAKFDFACAAFDAPLTNATNKYELPRVMVRDWDGATFRRILLSYLDDS